MRVLLLTDDLLRGGAAMHVTDLAHALSTSGHEVTVAATDGDLRERIPSSVRFLPLSLKDNATHRSRYRGIIPAFRTLSHECSSRRYDLIHSHKRLTHFLGKLLALRFHLPHITTYHTLFARPRSASFYGDVTICCSEAIRREIATERRSQRTSLRVIHNGVHPLPPLTDSERTSVRQRYGISDDMFVFGSVGQFVPEKDRVTLFAALAQLNGKPGNRPWKLLLQGFGPEEKELRRMRDQLHLEDRVVFVPGDAPVSEICSVSRVMVLNSVIEGFPLILLEAASVGTPHIASEIAGIPEFIEEGRTGLLIPPRSPQRLAEALERTMRDDGLLQRMSQNVRHRYLDSFTFGRMMNELNMVYAECTAKGAGA